MAMLLMGCTTKASYHFVDWMVAWSIDDYLEWNHSQQKNFDKLLKDTMAWHQRTQLTRYQQWLAGVQNDLAKPLSTRQLSEHLAQLGLFWEAIMLNIQPDAEALLSSMDDQQVMELMTNLREKNRQIAEDYAATPDEKLDQKRLAKTKKHIRRWIGRLTEEQNRFLSEWNSQFENTRILWLKNRKNWQQEFEQALQHRHDDRFSQRLNRLFVQPEKLRSADYQHKTAINVQHTINLIITLQNSLTERQRHHLDKKLDKWQLIFSELSAEAVGKTLARGE